MLLNEIGNKVVIIGDSLLNGIVDDTLSNNNRIVTVKHPACTANDLKFDVIKRMDHNNLDKKVTALNEKLKKFCDVNKIDLLTMVILTNPASVRKNYI